MLYVCHRPRQLQVSKTNVKPQRLRESSDTCPHLRAGMEGVYRPLVVTDTNDQQSKEQRNNHLNKYRGGKNCCVKEMTWCDFAISAEINAENKPLSFCNDKTSVRNDSHVPSNQDI